MKRLLFVVLIIIPCSKGVLAQENELPVPKNKTYISVDVLKPLFWFMRNQGFVIEPQVSYQSKQLIFNAIIGISDINSEIYNDELDYRNKGQYMKLGIGFQLNYNEEVDRRNKIILGGNLVFANFEENATVLTQFSNWGIMGDTNTQKNSARGMEIFFGYQHDFDNGFFIYASPRISAVFNELNNDSYPVYYIPGFGIVTSNDGNDSVFPSFFNSDDQGAVGVGLAFKIGYSF